MAYWWRWNRRLGYVCCGDTEINSKELCNNSSNMFYNKAVQILILLIVLHEESAEEKELKVEPFALYLHKIPNNIIGQR